MIYLSGCVRPDLPPDVGVMLTPMMGNRLPDDRVWAADTGCFAQPAKHDDNAYLAWLADRADASDRCLFATAPDVRPEFSNTPARDTLERSAPMFRHIRAAGFSAALVAQDGLEQERIPWDDFDALFIGGSTAWKLGDACTALVREANRLGKWTHSGRVNSLRRLRHVQWQGCRSADGTFVAFGPDKNIPRVEAWLRALRMQPQLWEAA